MKNYILFRGRHSDEMGVRITRLPPIIRAPERIETVRIPGRHGELTVLEGTGPTFGKIRMDVEGVTLPGADMDAALDWLSQSGDLIFSYDPNRRRIAHAAEAIRFESIMNGARHRRFSVGFDCHPFRYEAEPTRLTLTAPTDGGRPHTLIHPGGVPSEPEFDIYATGDLTLEVNRREIELSGLTGRIVLDTEIGDAYAGNELMNHGMRGEFPILAPGRNTITWTGDAQKVIVTPRWRWL